MRIARIAAALAVGVAVLTVPQTAQASSDQVCALNTCITYISNRVGGGYQGIATLTTRILGHVDLWGPGISFRHGPANSDGKGPLGVEADGIGSGWLCAHGWAKSGSTYVDVGFPCIEVHF